MSSRDGSNRILTLYGIGTSEDPSALAIDSTRSKSGNKKDPYLPFLAIPYLKQSENNTWGQPRFKSIQSHSEAK